MSKKPNMSYFAENTKFFNMKWHFPLKKTL